MKRLDEVWKTEEFSKRFLEGVRSAIPLAAEQIEIMLRLIRKSKPQVTTFLDLGCGDGILGRTVLASYPDSRGIFVDFSEPMINEAIQKIGSAKNRADFILEDFGQEKWVDAVKDNAPFDVIVSGLAIHHQPDKRKKAIYGELLNLLTPGGIFLNLEHVSSSSDWVKSVHDDSFIDSLYSHHQQNGGQNTKDQVAEEYYNRLEESNILAPVEDQCEWLRDLGFVNVDCFIKVFEVALFGGTKP